MRQEKLDQELSKSVLDLLSLPMQTKFRLLGFTGSASGVALNAQFNFEELRGRQIVIKSFQVIPFYGPVGGVDLFMDDGVTQSVEVIPASVRIDRLFDTFVDGTDISFFINNSPTPLFFQRPLFAGAVAPYVLDLNLDNIYYKHPEKLQSIEIRITSQIIANLQTGATAIPTVKVLVGVYVI